MCLRDFNHHFWAQVTVILGDTLNRPGVLHSRVKRIPRISSNLSLKRKKKDQDVEEPGNENGDINRVSMKSVSKHILMDTSTEGRNTVSVHFSRL